MLCRFSLTVITRLFNYRYLRNAKRSFRQMKNAKRSFIQMRNPKRNWKTCPRSYNYTDNRVKLAYFCLQNVPHPKINYFLGKCLHDMSWGSQKDSSPQKYLFLKLEILPKTHPSGCYVMILIITYIYINASLVMNHFHVNSFVWSSQQPQYGLSPYCRWENRSQERDLSVANPSIASLLSLPAPCFLMFLLQVNWQGGEGWSWLRHKGDQCLRKEQIREGVLEGEEWYTQSREAGG